MLAQPSAPGLPGSPSVSLRCVIKGLLNRAGRPGQGGRAAATDRCAAAWSCPPAPSRAAPPSHRRVHTTCPAGPAGGPAGSDGICIIIHICGWGCSLGNLLARWQFAARDPCASFALLRSASPGRPASSSPVASHCPHQTLVPRPPPPLLLQQIPVPCKPAGRPEWGRFWCCWRS